MALRSSHALGLHLRAEDTGASANGREDLARIWWGLYCLESILSSLTGRPNVALPSLITVPLPLPLNTEDVNESSAASLFGPTLRSKDASESLYQDEESSRDAPKVSRQPDPANTGSYLRATITVSIIMQRTLSFLYASNASKKSWADIQKAIGQLNEQLEDWVFSLPVGLNLSHGNRLPRRRERTALEFHYFSVKMMMVRISICVSPICDFVRRQRRL